VKNIEVYYNQKLDSTFLYGITDDNLNINYKLFKNLEKTSLSSKYDYRTKILGKFCQFCD